MPPTALPIPSHRAALTYLSDFAKAPYEIRKFIWLSALPDPNSWIVQTIIRRIIDRLITLPRDTYHASASSRLPAGLLSWHDPNGATELAKEWPCPWKGLDACVESRSVVWDQVKMLIEQNGVWKDWVRRVPRPFEDPRIVLSGDLRRLVYKCDLLTGSDGYDLTKLVFWKNNVFYWKDIVVEGSQDRVGEVDEEEDWETVGSGETIGDPPLNFRWARIQFPKLDWDNGAAEWAVEEARRYWLAEKRHHDRMTELEETERNDEDVMLTRASTEGSDRNYLSGEEDESPKDGMASVKAVKYVTTQKGEGITIKESKGLELQGEGTRTEWFSYSERKPLSLQTGEKFRFRPTQPSGSGKGSSNKTSLSEGGDEEDEEKWKAGFEVVDLDGDEDLKWDDESDDCVADTTSSARKPTLTECKQNSESADQGSKILSDSGNVESVQAKSTTTKKPKFY